MGKAVEGEHRKEKDGADDGSGEPRADIAEAQGRRAAKATPNDPATSNSARRQTASGGQWEGHDTLALVWQAEQAEADTTKRGGENDAATWRWGCRWVEAPSDNLGNSRWGAALVSAPSPPYSVLMRRASWYPRASMEYGADSRPRQGSLGLKSSLLHQGGLAAQRACVRFARVVSWLPIA